jgi:hypothetical protein
VTVCAYKQNKDMFIDLEDAFNEPDLNDSSDFFQNFAPTPNTTPSSYSMCGKREASTPIEIDFDEQDDITTRRSQHDTPQKHQRTIEDESMLGHSDGDLSGVEFKRYDFHLPQFYAERKKPKTTSTTNNSYSSSSSSSSSGAGASAVTTYSFSRTPSTPSEPSSSSSYSSSSSSSSSNGDMHVLKCGTTNIDTMLARRFPLVMARRNVLALAICTDMADLFYEETTIPASTMDILREQAKIALHSEACCKFAKPEQLSHLRNLAGNNPPFGLVVEQDSRWKPGDMFPTDEQFFAKFPELQSLNSSNGYQIPYSVLNKIKMH